MRLLATLLFLLVSVQCHAKIEPGHGLQPPPPPRSRAVPEAAEPSRRVLTLPGSRLSRSAGSPADGAVLPTFSILYVHDRVHALDGDWIEVGAKADGQSDGWLPVSQTQDWRAMLAMRYATRGKRDRIVFFRNRDELENLLNANNRPELGHTIETGLDAKPDPRLVAAEPRAAIDPPAQSDFLPVLSSGFKVLNDGTTVRLVEVAGASAAPRQDRPDVPFVAPMPAAPTTRDFRLGVVFLLNTTASMQPYLESIKHTIIETHDQLVGAGPLAHSSFGLVGYRGKGLEYVTQTYAALDPSLSWQRVSDRVDTVQAAPQTSKLWDADAFAGLHDALTGMDWSPFTTRILVLVTDSGAWSSKSPKVKYSNFDIGDVTQLADTLHVVIFPVHLLTPAGKRYGGWQAAAQQWQQLGGTGEGSLSRYTPISTSSEDAFNRDLSAFASRLVVAIDEMAANWPVGTTETATVQQASNSHQPVAEPTIPSGSVNEMFQAPFEYLGARQDSAASTFFHGWTSDHDLANSRLTSLDLQVFLTRDQLTDLARRLQLISDTAKQAALSPQAFFQNLQHLPADVSASPESQPSGTITSIGGSNLLPEFLKLLPYHGKVLGMTNHDWLDGGVIVQQEFIDDLDYKLQQYHNIDADPHRWTVLDRSNPGTAVSPVPLSLLP